MCSGVMNSLLQCITLLTIARCSYNQLPSLLVCTSYKLRSYFGKGGGHFITNSKMELGMFSVFVQTNWNS